MTISSSLYDANEECKQTVVKYVANHNKLKHEAEAVAKGTLHSHVLYHVVSVKHAMIACARSRPSECRENACDAKS